MCKCRRRSVFLVGAMAPAPLGELATVWGRHTALSPMYGRYGKFCRYIVDIPMHRARSKCRSRVRVLAPTKEQVPVFFRESALRCSERSIPPGFICQIPVFSNIHVFVPNSFYKMHEFYYQLLSTNKPWFATPILNNFALNLLPTNQSWYPYFVILIHLMSYILHQSHSYASTGIHRHPQASTSILGESNIRHEDFLRLFVRPSFVCHAQGTPPGFWNGVDWRALVQSRPPNIGKLRG